MNKEIEAHYTQYLFLKRSVEWTKQKKKKYTDSQRLRATTSLAEYINQQGYITTSDLDFFNAYLSNNVVSSFRNEGYENYPFKEYPDITKVFPNIKLTAKIVTNEKTITYYSHASIGVHPPLRFSECHH